jgi:DNA-binding MarR family transcriptional regulator
MMKPEQISEYIDRFEAVTFTVTRRLNALIRERIDSELTLDQFMTLRYIYNRGSCTASELSDTFCVNKSATTAITTRLADKQYITRIQDERDRRVVSLHLSEKGREVYETAARRIHEMLGRFIGQFTQEEIDQFLTIYEKLAVIIQRDGGDKT